MLYDDSYFGLSAGVEKNGGEVLYSVEDYSFSFLSRRAWFPQWLKAASTVHQEQSAQLSDCLTFIRIVRI